MKGNISLYKVCFFFISMILCILLSLRDIPSFYELNDSGRYVTWINAYCSSELAYYEPILDSMSYKLFYSTSTVSCMVTEPKVFLFIVALFIPLPFIIFGGGSRGSFIWMLAYLLSFFSFELMTNALRQGLGVMLFLTSLAFISKNRLLSFLTLILAILAHSSLAMYAPFYFGVLYDKLLFKILLNKVNLVIFSLCITLLLLVINEFGFFYDELDFYQSIYKNELNISFLLYVVSPVFLIYLSRLFIDKSFVTIHEVFCLWYTVILIAISYFLFPAITYRIVFLAVPIYMFVICRSNVSQLSGLITCSGMMIHLFIMMLFS